MGRAQHFYKTRLHLSTMFSMWAETSHKLTVPKCNVDLFEQCLTYQRPKL